MNTDIMNTEIGCFAKFVVRELEYIFMLSERRGVFRNPARGGGNPIFWQIERRSRTFFRLSPISNVKFGVLRGGPWPNAPPLNTPLGSH